MTDPRRPFEPDSSEPYEPDAAAGGLVADMDPAGDVRVVLIRSRRRKADVWSLPKGHFRKRETLEETALREVAEETGLQTRIVAPLGSIDYWFVEKGVRYHKFVHYFLMTPTGGSLDDHDDEVEEARWLRWDAAIARMTYPNERALIIERRANVVAALHALRSEP